MIAATIKSLQEMAGREFRPAQVAFTLARNSELREFERFFGCPVEFSASADQFSERDAYSPACHRRSALVGNASADLRGSGEGAQHGSWDAKVLSRERSAQIAASWQGQQAKSGEGAGVKRANAFAKAG